MDWHAVIQAWLGPAGLLVVFGCVVWGIQLNVAVMQLTRRQAMIEKQTESVQRQTELQSNNILRATLILEKLQKEIERFSDHMEKHEQEAELWKQRIVTLETKLDGMR